MKNIRVWVDDDKRCEGVWLAQLLTLCGCQVWTGRLAEKEYSYIKTDKEYVDILLLGSKNNNNYLNFINQYNSNKLIVCGKREKTSFLSYSPMVWSICSELDINQRESLESLMSLVNVIICEDAEEKSAILRLTHSYTEDKNKLSKAIYVITKLFHSRKIDYSKYNNVNVLIQAVSDTKEWLENYAREIIYPLTYAEMFMIVYLQNLIDEGYIKARKTGGYDTSKMFRDANFLLNNEPEADAANFLKLQILRNSINYREIPEDILSDIEKTSAPEYVGIAYKEVGDIYREESYRNNFACISFYEKSLLLNYSLETMYRIGLEYEHSGNCNLYFEAIKKYEEIVIKIEQIELADRTPEEFLLYCKAIRGLIVLTSHLYRDSFILIENKKTSLSDAAKYIIKTSHDYTKLSFLKKMYDGSSYKEIANTIDEMVGLIANICQKYA